MTSASSAIGVWIPSAGRSIKEKLSHRTSSTATELAAVRAALLYISGRPARRWVILSDSRPALQLLNKPPDCRNQLVCDMNDIFSSAVREGHEIFLQWIPGHSGITGNKISDAVAREAHDLNFTVGIPFSNEDSKAAAIDLGWQLQLPAWQDPLSSYAPLHAIDPQCDFPYPRGLPKRTEGVLHRLRLNVAYTRSFLFKLGWVESPLCTVCSTTDNIRHILSHCSRYASQRATASKALVRLRRGGTLELSHFLGPWQNREEAVLGTKTLLTFLAETGLEEVL